MSFNFIIEKNDITDNIVWKGAYDEHKVCQTVVQSKQQYFYGTKLVMFRFQRRYRSGMRKV